MSEERSSAGMIAAIAALITAVVGVGAFLYQVWPSDSSEPPTQTGAANGATTTPASPPAAASSAAAANPPDKPLWSGERTFGNFGIDFDAIPPVPTNNGDGDIANSSRQIATWDRSPDLVEWTQPQDPTPAECASLIATVGVGAARYDVGKRFCVKTFAAHRFVLVKFLKVNGDGSALIHATVWSAPN